MKLTKLTSVFLLLTFAMFAVAQEEPSESQQEIKQLAFTLGEWDGTKQDGGTFTMTYRLINDGSFIELVADMGDHTYREITRWDLAEKRFLTDAFGGAGGHGTFAWSKTGDNAWKMRGKTPYYWSSGQANEVDLTLTSVDKDTMTLVGSIGEMDVDNTAQRRKPKPEPAASKAWREFWVGDWHRVTEWTIDGVTTKSEYDWTCNASGDSNISFGTTGDGYSAVYAWMPDRAALVETGHSNVADWEIVFDPEEEETLHATSTGRMRDGRRGVGKNIIKRTGPDSYTAEATIKLGDGSTVRVIDRNTRK